MGNLDNAEIVYLLKSGEVVASLYLDRSCAGFSIGLTESLSVLPTVIPALHDVMATVVDRVPLDGEYITTALVVYDIDEGDEDILENIIDIIGTDSYVTIEEVDGVNIVSSSYWRSVIVPATTRELFEDNKALVDDIEMAFGIPATSLEPF